MNVNLRPYYAEGSKTLAFEIAEQLGWELPDRCVVPVASGSLFTKIAKGFEEWRDLGLLEGELPRMNGAQAEGCAPVASAFAAGHEVCRPVKPNTIAKSLAIGDPADGYFAAKMIRESGGWAEDVSDPEIVAAIELLAETEGIFGETAGGVTVGVMQKLIAHLIQRSPAFLPSQITILCRVQLPKEPSRSLSALRRAVPDESVRDGCE